MSQMTFLRRLLRELCQASSRCTTTLRARGPKPPLATGPRRLGTSPRRASSSLMASGLIIMYSREIDAARAPAGRLSCPAPASPPGKMALPSHGTSCALSVQVAPRSHRAEIRVSRTRPLDDGRSCAGYPWLSRLRGLCLTWLRPRLRARRARRRLMGGRFLDRERRAPVRHQAPARPYKPQTTDVRPAGEPGACPGRRTSARA